MIFKNCSINGEITDIRTENGKIAEIGKLNEQGTDLGGAKVFPGLIDINSHGCIGCDTMDGDKLVEMSAFLAKQGVTSWLPTTMTMDMDTIKKVVNIDIPETNGAEILGFHMEGPYISRNRKGAQNDEYIKAPDINEFNGLRNIKMITLAPELYRSMQFIEKCSAIVSIGHTDANYDCAMEAIERGARCLTHTFNAMPFLHHREPGPIGAAIDKDIYVQVICDGLHIYKSVIKLLYRTFDERRMILISDSMRATGLEDGEYEFGGQSITVINSIARTQGGAIAGSTSTLLQCVKKAIEFGIPEQAAFDMASKTPADLLGLNKGRIEPGCDADFIAVDDEYNAILTVKSGRIIS